MSKAVPFKSGGLALLVETDDDVELPVRLPVNQPVHRVPDPEEEDYDDSDIFIPKGMEEVVSVADIKRDLGEVKDAIVACCNSLYSAVGSIPPPQKFGIEFGIKLAGEKGIPFLTKASGEANFKITVEWGK